MLQVVVHFEVQTLLKVGFPLWVIGIGPLSYLHMPFDPGLEGERELHLMRSLVVCCLAVEDPISIAS